MKIELTKEQLQTSVFGSVIINTLRRLLWGLLLTALGNVSVYAQSTGATSSYFTGYQIDQLTGMVAATYSMNGAANSSDSVNCNNTNGYHIPNSNVVLVFAGPYWTAGIQGFQASQQLMNAAKQMVNSSYFTGLTAYGWNSTTGVQSAFDPTPVPANYSFGNVNAIVARVVSSFPNPANRANIFMVMMPPGSTTGSFKVAGGLGTVPLEAGSHWNSDGSFTNGQGGLNNNQVGYVATDTVPNMERILSHELVESITDPDTTHTNVLGIPDRLNCQMDKSFGGVDVLGIAFGESEIADAACGNNGCLQDIVNGTTVSAYWMQSLLADGIPYGPATTLAGNALASYYDSNDQTIHAFYLADNEHVEELFWNGSRWSYRDLIDNINGNVAIANGATTLTAYWDAVHDVGYVFYIGKDNDIYQLVYEPSGNPFGIAPGWYGGNLTASIRVNNAYAYAPPVTPAFSDALALTTYYDSGSGTIHLIYNSGGALIDLYYQWYGNPNWQSQTIGGTPGTTQLAGMFDGIGHVFYVDSSHNIQEVQNISSQHSPYSYNNWSFSAGAMSDTQLPATDTIATAFDTWGAEHVYYISTAGHVMQLTQAGGTYTTEDVTAAAQMNTTATTGATGQLTAFKDDLGRIHVIYGSPDGNLHELIRTFGTLVSTPGAPFFYDAWAFSEPTISTGASVSVGSRLIASTFAPYTAPGVPGALQMVFYLQKDLSGVNSTWQGDVGELYSLNHGAWNSNSGANAPTGWNQANAPIAVP